MRVVTIALVAVGLCTLQSEAMNLVRQRQYGEGGMPGHYQFPAAGKQPQFWSSTAGMQNMRPAAQYQSGAPGRQPQYSNAGMQNNVVYRAAPMAMPPQNNAVPYGHNRMGAGSAPVMPYQGRNYTVSANTFPANARTAAAAGNGHLFQPASTADAAVLNDGRLKAEYRDKWVLFQKADRKVKTVENGKLIFHPKIDSWGKPALDEDRKPLRDSAWPNEVKTAQAIMNGIREIDPRTHRSYVDRRYKRRGHIYMVKKVTSNPKKGILYHLATDPNCKMPTYNSANRKQKPQPTHNVEVTRVELGNFYKRLERKRYV